MDNSITVVQGNDFTLNITLSTPNKETQATDPYDIRDAKSLEVKLISQINGHVLRLAPSEIVGKNVISTLVSGTKLKLTDYDVEVSFVKGGLNKRAYECNIIHVVRCQGDTDYSTQNTEGEKGYGIDLTMGIDIEVVNLGKNVNNGSGTLDYNDLEHKPSINDVVLEGNKTLEDLGMYSKRETDEKFETKSHAADTFQTKESAAEADRRVQSLIDILNSDSNVDGSVKKTVADAVARVVAGAPEDLDTLREIADYIASDKTGAAQLAAAISQLQTLTEKHTSDIAGNASGVAENKAGVAALKTLTAGHTKSIEDLRIAKQDALVSGTNIKTINNQSILGSGNISIESGTSITVDSELSTTSENPVQNKVITNTLQTKANASDIPTKVSQLENDSKFATQTAVATGLATKADKDSLTSLEGSVSTLETTVRNQDKSIIANAQAIQGKQDKLVSGTNIKTINNQSILGSGNISIEGGGSTVVVDDALSDTSENPVQNKVITTRVTSIETSLASKANASDVPTKTSQLENDSTYQTKANLDTALESYAKTSDVNSKNALQDEAIQSKQDKLISGTNIKTINSQSLLGSGNISIESGTSITVDNALSTTSENPVQNKVITTKVNSLETSLASKASQTDLDSLSSTVTTQGQTITSIQAEIGDINTQLTEING